MEAKAESRLVVVPLRNGCRPVRPPTKIDDDAEELLLNQG